MYDYVVVGAGLFGAVFAHEVKKVGKKVLAIEKRDHIGGNCYSYDDPETGINIHQYGPHVFHTPDKKIWDYINSFSDFNHYQHRILTNMKGEIYSLPINLATINKFYKVNLTPGEAAEFLKSKISVIPEPANLEEKAISLVGKELYEAFIKGYTSKQWNCDPGDLPADVITRLPVRTSYDDIYYYDHYQGMPVGGYAPIFEKLFEGVPLELKTDFFEKRDYWTSMAGTIVYTGPLDRYFDYRYGKLRWRSCRFEIERMPVDDYQGVSIINYADAEVPYTRVLEPKHFYREKINLTRGTVVIREFPCDNQEEPYYPVRLQTDQAMLAKYRAEQNREKNVIFGGRLAEYKYYDMWQVISKALQEAGESLRINFSV